MDRLREQYKNEVIDALMKQFGYKNVHQVPKLEKISINIGVGSATQNKALLDSAVKDLERITGRKPIITKAKKSISNFRLREGMPIGCKVTLRGEIMYEFFDRLISLTIPRIRDFKGVPLNSFDGRGNYTLGVKEQTIFTEIDIEKADVIRGLSITINTTARSDEEGRALLTELGMPFYKPEA
ncbi:MAG: 50S ribosomal protein L5 [Candidatus Cloacimonas sp.]|nr:50S ribosomal protein L5 [Candidatus Cloacimonadota bacterium]